MKKVFSNTVVQVLGKAVMVVTGLVITGLLTRGLGSEGYGDFLLIQSLMLIIMSLAGMGTEIIGVREINKKGIGIFKEVVVLRKILSLAGLGIMAGIILIFPPLLKIKEEALVAGLIVLAIGFSEDVGIWLHAQLKMGWKTLMEIVPMFLVAAVLTAMRVKISLWQAMVVYLASRMVTVVLGWWLILGKAVEKQGLVKRKVNWEVARKLIIMSWPMGVYLLLFTSYDKVIDTFIIRQFLGRENVAWYGLAYKIYGNLVLPAYFLVSSVFPLLSGSKKKSRDRELIKGGLVVLLILAAVGLPIIWWIAPVAIQIIGGTGFEPGVIVLRVLSLALSLAYVNHMLGFVIVAGEGQKKILTYGITAAFFNIIANLLIIPIWGIKGAAGVTVATEALMTIMMGFFLRKIRKI